MVVLKELIFTIYTLEGCGSPERTDFILTCIIFYLGGYGSLKKV